MTAPRPQKKRSLRQYFVNRGEPMAQPSPMAPDAPMDQQQVIEAMVNARMPVGMRQAALENLSFGRWYPGHTTYLGPELVEKMRKSARTWKGFTPDESGLYP